MGAVAIASGLKGAQVRDHHHEAQRLCAELHDRMPVIVALKHSRKAREEPPGVEQIKALLAPVSVGGDHVLAGERAGRECSEQRPEPDRPDWGGVARSGSPEETDDLV